MNMRVPMLGWVAWVLGAGLLAAALLARAQALPAPVAEALQRAGQLVLVVPAGTLVLVDVAGQREHVVRRLGGCGHRLGGLDHRRLVDA